MKKNIIILAIIITAALSLSSCDDFLDRKPLDKITPEIYFSTAEQLGTYAISRYSFISADGYSLGPFRSDNDTDVQVSSEGNQNRWVPGLMKVSSGDGGWNFENVYKLNYFLDRVIPKWKNNQIAGSTADIEHYIGEIYMLRAKEYYEKLKSFGDFPIIRSNISIDDKKELIKANERKPMNEVARFIISDLDSAIILMHKPASDDSKRNRLNKNAALLLKSRVALYTGSWLKNFKGTAFVPGGDGWPGANKSYHAGFNLNIDEEINYFLSEAMNAALEVAENVPLVQNNQESYYKGNNPYVLMYTDKDLSIYPEVLFWRACDVAGSRVGYGFAHSKGGSNTGYTKAYVNSFVMKDGTPIYASSDYLGDDNLQNVKENRDNRLVQFLKIKGEELSIKGDGSIALIPEPNILTTAEYKSTTGYDLKKGLTMSVDDKTGPVQESGLIVYRAVEAYLNYIEASYLKEGNLNTVAKKYWEIIRERAGVNTNIQQTINKTDMNQEKDLLSAYTAGKLVDPTLYNIRRERACELMSEGLRWDDLRRWRSMDQLIHEKYIIEGFKIWGEMKEWYNDESGNSSLTYLGDDAGTRDANVSSPLLSIYLRPYQTIKNNNNLYDGYSWMAANYLSPLGISQFNITSIVDQGGINYETSPLYQNPGWGTDAGSSAKPVPGF